MRGVEKSEYLGFVLPENGDFGVFFYDENGNPRGDELFTGCSRD